MNKKMIAALCILAMTVTALAGCSGKETGTAPEPAAEEPLTEEPAAEEPAETEGEYQTGMGNPWVEITEEEAKKLCNRLFKAPEGAEELVWMKCENLGDPKNGLGPLVQLKFVLDGMYFTARAQQGAKEDDDISGIYGEWTTGPDDVTLANWGEGHMAGKVCRMVDDLGSIDLITWYDIEIGIKYSLSVDAENLDGFDIQAIAEQMYCAENEPDTGN